MFKSDKLLSVTIIYNKANTFGLEKDAQLIKRALSGYATIRFADPLEHPVVQDINIQDLPFYLNVVKMVKDYDVEGTPEVFLNEDETGKHKAAIL